MHVLTVDQLTAYLKDLLDTDPILSDVWIRGEVTSFFESRAGHCYFTLSGDGAQLKSVLFRGNRAHLGHAATVGDAIVAHGNVSIYPDQGQYQLYVDFLAPEGAGILQIQFDELRQRLEAEGLFDESRKRPLPDLPRAIGIVTSAEGAVLHDVLTVLRRRFPAVEVVLSASMVQGSGAPASVISALERLWAEGSCDVIIIARGGGAPEELAVFNDEGLARAIFTSPVPVISAIGHETDVTIADFVADMRAPTPSVAAEIVVPHRRDIAAAIRMRLDEVRDVIEWKIEDRRSIVYSHSRIAHRASPGRHLDRDRRAVEMLRLRAGTAMRRIVEARRHTLGSFQVQSDMLNPAAVLARGYAAVERVDTGQRLRTAAAIARAETFRLTLSDGTLVATLRGERVERK